MSEEIGPVDLRDSEEHPFLGREIAQPRRFSESSARAVDQAVREILLGAEAAATQVITAHRVELDKLIDRLERDETLDRKQIEACLGGSVDLAPEGPLGAKPPTRIDVPRSPEELEPTDVLHISDELD